MVKYTLCILAILILFLCFVDRSLAGETIKIGITDDTYTEEGASNILTWIQPNMCLGWDTLYAKQRTRIYLYTSLKSVVDQGYSVNDILSTKLYLWQYVSEASSDYTVEWGNSLIGWDQYKINWLNQPQFIKQGELVFGSDLGWKTIDFNDSLKNWYLNGDVSVGVILKNQNEFANGGIFWSSDCLNRLNFPRCESWQTPYLEVTIKDNHEPTKPELINPVFNSVQAVSQIDFTWSPSTDIDGDSLTYGIEVSEDQSFLNSSVIVSALTTSNYSYTVQIDGTYYYRVFVEDNRGKLNKKVYSDSGVVTVDTTPPEIPLLDEEPPYSFSDENTITWSFDINKEPAGVEFLIEKVEIKGDLEVTEQTSTIDRGYKFTGLNESKYCFRVSAKDSVGNVSDWSAQTCTIQDFTSPVIDTLHLTNEYISPLNSVGILDSSELSFEITENNIESWKLFVEDSKRQLVYSQEGNQNSVSQVLPNDQVKLEEGVYFIYLVVQDKVNQIGKSNVIRLVVDNTSPQVPQILSPKNNLKSNSSSISLTAYFALNTKTQLILNNAVIAETQDTKLQQELPQGNLLEGENTLNLISSDLAGNTSQTTQTFVLDRIAPAIPAVSLTPMANSESLTFNFESSDFKKAEIYSKAGLVKETFANSTLIVDQWAGDSDYYYAVILIDDVGNRSPMSEFANFHTPKKEVLGVGTISANDVTFPQVVNYSSCDFKYNKTYNTFTKEKCELFGPVLSKISNFTPDKKSYTLTAIAAYSPKVFINIKNVYCKEKTIIDPRTWFSCLELSNSGSAYTVVSGGDVWIEAEGQQVRHFDRSVSNDVNIISKHLFSQDVSNKDGDLLATVNFSVRGPNFHWIDIFDKSIASKKVKIEQSVFNPYRDAKGRYFRFPFNQIIGVTQWHGYTAFDSPHTGIDFGSVLVPVYAMADGYIAAAGWDNYYGECFSGGNYVKITYDNGMTSFLAHLDNYHKADGNNWSYGERVSRGDLIGITGNSGASNCEPLGYHLHLELRKDLWQSSHVDPVPYIDVDWMQVDTLGEEYAPGRLSGDNPHTSY